MLTAVAHTTIRHPHRMLAAALATFAVAMIVGAFGLSALNARSPFVDPECTHPTGERDTTKLVDNSVDNLLSRLTESRYRPWI